MVRDVGDMKLTSSGEVDGAAGRRGAISSVAPSGVAGKDVFLARALPKGSATMSCASPLTAAQARRSRRISAFRSRV